MAVVAEIPERTPMATSEVVVVSCSSFSQHFKAPQVVQRLRATAKGCTARFRWNRLKARVEPPISSLSKWHEFAREPFSEPLRSAASTRKVGSIPEHSESCMLFSKRALSRDCAGLVDAR